MFPHPPASRADPLDYRLIVVLSLLLSAWLIFIDPVIARDGIIYLRAADAYLQDGLLASQQVFGRPILSICIAMLHQLTGLSLVHAGQLLNSLFYALLCVAFVASVRTMGGGRRVQILAAAIILSHPVIGDYRSSIMRDPAFWAFMVLAFRSLLLFSRDFSWQHQLQWFAWIVAAVLFRFEGLFFAAMAPLAMLFTGDRHNRLGSCLRLLVPQLLAIIALLLAVLLYQRVLNPGARLFPDIEKYLQGLLDFPQQFAELAISTGDALLKFTAREDATTATLAGLAAVLVLNICRAITMPWVLTLLWGWTRGFLAQVKPADAAVLNTHLAISLLYLGTFMLIRQFVLERYTTIFAIFALLYLPFVLDALWQGANRKVGRIFVVVLLVAMSADIIHNHDYRKSFIRDAAEWLTANTPAQASLLTNDRYIAYFSERQVRWRKGKPADYQFDATGLASNPALWREVDYLAFAAKPHELAAWRKFLDQYSLSELAVFDGGRMGRIAVVKIPRKPQP